MRALVKKLPDYRQIASQIKKREVKVTPEEIESLRQEKERRERDRVREEILRRIAGASEIEISEEVTRRERDLILENLKQQVSQVLRMNFEDYLAKIQKTEQELAEALLPEARKRVENLLVLRAIAERENIQASEQEAEKEAGRIMEKYPNVQNIDQNQLKEYAKEIIRNEKTLQLLENL